MSARIDRETMPYRDCVGVALFNPDGRVFVGRRIHDGSDDTSEVGAPWQMPQGGIDPGEDPLPAAYRELYEETSVRTIRFLAETDGWLHYDLPDDVLGIALKGRYRGQRQKWFAFLHEGDDSEIAIANPAEGAHPAEFDAWRWEELASLPDLIVPFKRDVYQQVVAAFAHIPGQLRRG